MARAGEDTIPHLMAIGYYSTLATVTTIPEATDRTSKFTKITMAEAPTNVRCFCRAKGVRRS